MNKRQQKKLQTKARVKWLVFHYGTVERSYLADYYNLFPTDWKKVRKGLKHEISQYIYNHTNNDVKSHYKFDDYDIEKSKRVVNKIRNSNFIPYYFCKDRISLAFEFDLFNLPNL